MQQSKIFRSAFVFLTLFFVVSCNDGSTDSRDASADTSAAATGADNLMPAYDQALDPLTVEAAFANKLSDTLGVKMYEVTLKPGDSVAIHNHPDHSMYVVEGGKLSITVQGQTARELDLTPGMGMMAGPENHNGKNVGTTTIKLLLHDIYRPRK